MTQLALPPLPLSDSQRLVQSLAAPIYGWFSEGFETADLKRAKDLLVHVASET